MERHRRGHAADRSGDRDSHTDGASTSGGYDVYTVVSGDTISGIAARFGVSVDEIQDWNPGLNIDRISIGQEIAVRGGASGGSGRQRRSVSYEVQAGDFVEQHREPLRRHRLTRSPDGTPASTPTRIRIGQEIIIMMEGPEAESYSVGHAYDGELVARRDAPRPPRVLGPRLRSRLGNQRDRDGDPRCVRPRR